MAMDKSGLLAELEASKPLPFPPNDFDTSDYSCPCLGLVCVGRAWPLSAILPAERLELRANQPLALSSEMGANRMPLAWRSLAPPNRQGILALDKWGPIRARPNVRACHQCGATNAAPPLLEWPPNWRHSETC